ncbi:MAG: hydroxypyruvate isomerase family protein [Gemmataceae bacterium]
MFANQQSSPSCTRRRVLQSAAALAAAGALGIGRRSVRAAEPVIKNKRLKQSIVRWCFDKHWSLEQMCQQAKRLGCDSVEIVAPVDFPVLKKHGLICAIAPSHTFVKGMNNPKYHEMCLDKMRTAIDACAEAGFPNVITFTGFREDIADDEGIKNCVSGYKKIVGYAEKKNVTLCLEMLNSRVHEEMKGHPGYQGDHTDYCLDIIKQVGSPRLKLLFDIYHVQIMDGDVIQRIRHHAEHIGHVHTAGNPGRGELDDKQEINYPPIMKALVEVKYTGYVGQEFIPTRDPAQGLAEAVRLCDV